MNKEWWNKNIDIISDIFTHHNIDHNIYLMYTDYSFQGGGLVASKISYIEMQIDIYKFISFKYGNNNFIAQFSKITGLPHREEKRKIENITNMDDIYNLSAASAHLINGHRFCNHCTLGYEKWHQKNGKTI